MRYYPSKEKECLWNSGKKREKRKKDVRITSTEPDHFCMGHLAKEMKVLKDSLKYSWTSPTLQSSFKIEAKQKHTATSQNVNPTLIWKSFRESDKN